MKLLSLLLLALALPISFALAADPAQPKPMDAKQQEMMKKFMAYATPGPQHKVLEGLVGSWACTTKMWETPTSKEENSTGTSSIKMILNGHFLQQDFSGVAAGQKFEGMGLIGYNNLENRYETTWIDSMATGTMHGTGTFDAKTKTLTDGGKASCPLTADKTRSYRSEWKIKDKNNMVFTMFGPDLDSGKEFKMMEIVYKRKM